MRTGRILGTVVATRKDPRLEGMKLLIVQPTGPDGRDEGPALVAVDTVSAGSVETVLFVTGSSARLTERTRDCPVDAAIVGIVDAIDLRGARPK